MKSQEGSMSHKATHQRLYGSVKYSYHLSVTNRLVKKRCSQLSIYIPLLMLFQFYVVMATHETGAFIHVFDGESKSPAIS